MHMHSVTGAKKLKEVRRFFELYIDDHSTSFVFTAQEASDLGVESNVIACYDRNGIAGAAHFTTPFEDAKELLEKGVPERHVVTFINRYRMLYNIAVREDLRDAGVGALLLETVERGVRARGATEVIGIAEGDLARLEKFYRQSGYEVLELGHPLELTLAPRVGLTLPLHVSPQNMVRWFKKSL